MNKFKLLKDLPGVKAGVIFSKKYEDEPDETFSYLSYGEYTYSLEDILKYPDWFAVFIVEKYPKDIKDVPYNKTSYVPTYLSGIVTSNEKQYKSIEAFAQLTQLYAETIKVYNKKHNCDWKPVWHERNVKFVIVRTWDNLTITNVGYTYNPFPFPTEELAKFAVEHWSELWKQYYEL